jgi:hypothetical protein
MNIKDRKNPRALIHVPAEYYVSNLKIDCLVVDLSISGIRINIDNNKKLPKNFEILLFILPETPPLQAKVQKVWRNKLQAGLEFIELGKKEKKVFDALIKIHRAENIEI